ncbi:MAG TPA: nucleotidyltransferase domain-containing protein [Chthoniobacterales bacterium]|nr:nucleotidyltransferase domain-containing protein [Chthoniobacterales bacterium]
MCELTTIIEIARFYKDGRCEPEGGGFHLAVYPLFVYIVKMTSISDIQRYCEEVARLFKPRRIVLFGSHAYGQPHVDSDVDVLVVMRGVEELGRQPTVTIRTQIKAPFPVDMLVRDEREVSRRLREGDSFMCDIAERGRVLYEAVHA